MPDIRRFLPSGRNAVALGCGFLLAFLLWWWTARSRPASTSQAFSPASELDRVVYAITNARSWRVTTSGSLRGQPFETEQAVVCPFDSHTVTRTAGAQGAGTLVEEFIETKDTLYAREGGQPWHSQPKVSMDNCRTGPAAGPASLIDTLDRLRVSAKIRKGALLQLDGSSCRTWDFLAAAGADGSLGSICVDDTSHLPYEVRLGSLRVRYSRWNQPAAILPPYTR
jgi:hypothetical protein